MEKIITITAPDGFTFDKSWNCNCSTDQELLKDFSNNHTFLIGYTFELIKGV